MTKVSRKKSAQKMNGPIFSNKNDFTYRISSIFSITLNIRSPSIFSKIIIFSASKIRSQDFK